MTYHDSDTEWFDYDKLGNRVEAKHRDSQSEITYARNALTNRYDQTGTYDIKAEYDEAGNTTKDPNGYEYSYDYENRLIKITRGEDDIAEYTYDALGRRIQVYDMVAETKTQYYYNDNWQVLTETDEEGYELRSFVYGNYIDEVLVMIDPNVAEDYYYAHDHLFSPVALMDDTGSVVERYEYDAYGHPTIWDSTFSSERDTSSYNNPYVFTGRRVDVLDSDDYMVQYSRNRYYDYYTGRMLTHDPIGYFGGMNLYNYARYNPILYFDPHGLISLRVGWSGEITLAAGPTPVPGVFWKLQAFGSTEFRTCCGETGNKMMGSLSFGFRAGLVTGFSHEQITETAKSDGSENWIPPNRGVSNKSSCSVSSKTCPDVGCKGKIEVYAKAQAGIHVVGLKTELKFIIYPSNERGLNSAADIAKVSGLGVEVGVEGKLICWGVIGQAFAIPGFSDFGSDIDEAAYQTCIQQCDNRFPPSGSTSPFPPPIDASNQLCRISCQNEYKPIPVIPDPSDIPLLPPPPLPKTLTEHVYPSILDTM